jgi:hypothetical protein
MRTVAVQIKDLVREFGGANSSEHGDGGPAASSTARSSATSSTRPCGR